MTQSQRERFAKLRKIVAEQIRYELEIDDYCKSYEGTWELCVSYPNYFDDETGTAKPDFYQITLHCYVIGPNRHYEWPGKDWDEALTKCERDIAVWCGKEDS